MTVVANAGADAFIRRLPPKMKLFLVHGSDEGLVHERAKAIVDAALAGDKDPMRLTRLEGPDVARDPGRLLDEASAISMFGGERALWIETQGRDLVAALKPLMDRPPDACTIVIEAGNLKRGAALRNAFEKCDGAASIECYPDGRGALAPLIEAEARAAGLNIDAEARDFLVSMLGADRGATRSEIAKLLLYARGQSSIGVADIQAIVSGAAPSALDGLVDAAFLGDAKAVEHFGARFFAEEPDANFLMIQLVRRLLLLHRLRLEMDNGFSFDSAMQALFVKLPPSAKAALGRQAETWSSAALARRLASVQDAAARVRREAKLADAIAMRALWTLARSAQSRR